MHISAATLAKTIELAEARPLVHIIVILYGLFAQTIIGVADASPLKD